jgi:hypothetical protein
MLSHYFWEKTWSDPAIFWAMATFVFTVALVGVAWKELGDLARTSRADFIFRLKNNFFTEDARRLLFMVDVNLLQFEDSEIPYFTIRKAGDPNLRSRFEELGIKGSTVSTYVVDDVLLGPLEDVDMFLTGKLITEKNAYEMFDTYVTSCAENEEIQKYIKSTRRKPNNSDIYSGFDHLYKRLRAAAPQN